MYYFLDEQQLKAIIQSLYFSGTEEDYYEKIQTIAKKNNISSEFLLKTIRGYIISQKSEEIKDQDKYYHATDIESFKKILKSGYLLSRKERIKNGEDLSNLHWSSSQKIQFSLNRIVLQAPVTFVFGKRIYEEETFYPSRIIYPTADKININNACIAIIVRDEYYDEIIDLLHQTKFAKIPVIKLSKWEPTISNSFLEQIKMHIDELNDEKPHIR